MYTTVTHILFLTLWLFATCALGEARQLSTLYSLSNRQIYPRVTTPTKIHSYKVTRLNARALSRTRFSFITPDGRRLYAIKKRTGIPKTIRTERHSPAYTETITGLIKEKIHGGSVGEYVISLTRRSREIKKAFHGGFYLYNEPTSLVLTNDKTRRSYTLQEVHEDLQPPCGGDIHPLATRTLPHAHQIHERRQTPHDIARTAPVNYSRDEVNTVIDVAILYSHEAQNAVGGLSNLVSEANTAISSANQAYVNSLIPQELRLVYAGPSTTSENTAMSTDLGRLATSSDGYYTEADDLPSSYGADIISLFMQVGDACGLGYISYGYNVVMRSCISNLSYQHELGHNMGAMHDLANAGGMGAYAYSYGWRFIGSNSTQYRTVMAYAPGIRVNYFSNPDVTYWGVATGTSTANNALTLTNTRTTVASWAATVATTTTTRTTTTSTTTTVTTTTTRTTTTQTTTTSTTTATTTTTPTTTATSTTATSTTTVTTATTRTTTTATTRTSTTSTTRTTTTATTTTFVATTTTTFALPTTTSTTATTTTTIPEAVESPTPSPKTLKIGIKRGRSSVTIRGSIRGGGTSVRSERVKVEYQKRGARKFALLTIRRTTDAQFSLVVKGKGRYRFTVVNDSSVTPVTVTI